jgi:hypothetical protein
MKRIVALLAALALVVVTGCPKKDKGIGSGSSETATGGTAGHKTPQEVFDAAKTAIMKDDLKTFVDCLAPESIETMAGAMACTQLPPKRELLAKHGLTDEIIKKLPKMKGVPSAEDQEKIFKAWSVPIKDKAAFLVEVFAARLKEEKNKMKELGSTALKDLKIDGDKATGKIVGLPGGKEEPVEFKKMSGGGWKVVLTD